MGFFTNFNFENVYSTIILGVVITIFILGFYSKIYLNNILQLIKNRLYFVLSSYNPDVDCFIKEGLKDKIYVSLIVSDDISTVEKELFSKILYYSYYVGYNSEDLEKINLISKNEILEKYCKNKYTNSEHKEKIYNNLKLMDRLTTHCLSKHIFKIIEEDSSVFKLLNNIKVNKTSNSNFETYYKKPIRYIFLYKTEFNNTKIDMSFFSNKDVIFIKYNERLFRNLLYIEDKHILNIIFSYVTEPFINKQNMFVKLNLIAVEKISELNNKIISVIGCPGCGKTTFMDKYGTQDINKGKILIFKEPLELWNTKDFFKHVKPYDKLRISSELIKIKEYNKNIVQFYVNYLYNHLIILFSTPKLTVISERDPYTTRLVFYGDNFKFKSKIYDKLHLHPKAIIYVCVNDETILNKRIKNRKSLTKIQKEGETPDFTSYMVLKHESLERHINYTDKPYIYKKINNDNNLYIGYSEFKSIVDKIIIKHY